MPYYDYMCTNVECRHIFECEYKMSEFKEAHPLCPKCNTESIYKFTPTIIQFALKDGLTGSWPSKGERFKKYRSEASARAKRRQKERYGDGNTLTPNFQGRTTENWREAQSLAMQDKDLQEKTNKSSLEIAATYNEKINKENSKKIVSK